jgi:hypothetical protein
MRSWGQNAWLRVIDSDQGNSPSPPMAHGPSGRGIRRLFAEWCGVWVRCGGLVGSAGDRLIASPSVVAVWLVTFVGGLGLGARWGSPQTQTTTPPQDSPHHPAGTLNPKLRPGGRSPGRLGRPARANEVEPARASLPRWLPIPGRRASGRCGGIAGSPQSWSGQGPRMARLSIGQPSQKGAGVAVAVPLGQVMRDQQGQGGVVGGGTSPQAYAVSAPAMCSPRS